MLDGVHTEVLHYLTCFEEVVRPRLNLMFSPLSMLPTIKKIKYVLEMKAVQIKNGRFNK